MSRSDDIGAERGGDDVLAGEYVLGVLSADERAAATARIEREADFARLVDWWETWLAPLALAAFPPIEAPDGVKAAIDKRLFSDAARNQAGRSSAPASAGFWSSLMFWRSLAALALVILAALVAVPLLDPSTEPSRLVASLSAEGTDVRYLALYDADRGEVSLSHVSGDRDGGHDFELWMIEGSQAPVSMGVIPVGAAVHLEVAEAIRNKLEAGAVLAVSSEPAGGSPTGQPTGPVVAAGDLRSVL